MTQAGVCDVQEAEKSRPEPRENKNLRMPGLQLLSLSELDLLKAPVPQVRDLEFRL